MNDKNTQQAFIIKRDGRLSKSETIAYHASVQLDHLKVRTIAFLWRVNDLFEY